MIVPVQLNDANEIINNTMDACRVAIKKGMSGRIISVKQAIDELIEEASEIIAIDGYADFPLGSITLVFYRGKMPSQSRLFRICNYELEAA